MFLILFSWCLLDNWRRCCVGSGFLCFYSLWTQRRHCEDHHLTAATAGVNTQTGANVEDAIIGFLCFCLCCFSFVLPSSMGLFLVLQLVFGEMPVSDSGQRYYYILLFNQNSLCTFS
ncbi:hypothetical protein XENORESO_008616 [Xenotaenia resolanae]|uniref:Uncharacterized protein n=1 Tax=Xenotaenia resolanae TaxID=208358 RepID=A0ABV0VLK1_9TELE